VRSTASLHSEAALDSGKLVLQIFYISFRQ
jgi:hypothetical protein